MSVQIKLCDQKLCTGCEACKNACPADCIEMAERLEGFLYPKIDAARCIECGKCVESCPVINKPELDRSHTPNVYAAWHEDNIIRLHSASGGAFSALAETVISSGGHVFGAAYGPDLHVRHMGVEDVDSLCALRGSKYVQSEIGMVYRDIRTLLLSGAAVLFSGTPCQVAGLYGYLGRDYERLYTCDLICHGVPSPEVFAKYVAWVNEVLGAKLESLNFRDKSKGWENFRTVAVFGNGRKRVLSGIRNNYHKGFIANLYLRDCCHNCPFDGFPRMADLTLGDFWGIGKRVSFDEDGQKEKGISVVMANSSKGQLLLGESKRTLVLKERTLQEAVDGNPLLHCSATRHWNRDLFFQDFKTENWDHLSKKYFKLPFSLSIKNKLRRGLWNTVYVLLFRPFKLSIFSKWRLFLLRSFGAKIGRGSVVYSTAHIWAPWNLEMGEFSCLASDSICFNVDKVVIGNKVTVSHYAFVCTASHDIAYIGLPLITKPIYIESYAWVCARAFVGPGVTIGEGAVVDACAVATKDVASWTVVGGNPARYIKDRVMVDQK